MRTASKMPMTPSRHAPLNWKPIRFTGENVFTAEHAKTHQNRSWSPQDLSVEDLGAKFAPATRYSNFCGSRCKNQPRLTRDSRSKAFYIPEGVRQLIWCETLRNVAGPNSPTSSRVRNCGCSYLNTIDYSIWWTLETRLRVKPHKRLTALKTSLRREGDRISPDELLALSKFPGSVWCSVSKQSRIWNQLNMS